MDNIWKNKFENANKKFPNQIALGFWHKLYDITNKKVIAKVEKYKVNINDMTEQSPLMNIAKINPLFSSTNVQDFLGEVDGKNKFTYELYLTGEKTSNYKYRFCFIEYSICAYPVTVAIDSDIAKELEMSEIVHCKDDSEYEKVLIAILNSKKMTEVIEGLMKINS